MSREYKGVRYTTLDEIPTKPLLIQGTIYHTPEEAKYAAAKLFCNVKGVIVKQVKAGWSLFWWR